MKAMILAAGKGTRMGALTQEIPKPMIPVRGRPMLERIMTGLAEHGNVRDFFILTGHLGHIIRDHFGDGSDRGWTICYGEQTVQDGTGSAVAFGRAWAGVDPFFLAYGDILMEPREYAACRTAFQGADGLITVRRAEDVSKGGAVAFDADFVLEQIIEKAPPGVAVPPWYNAGFYGLSAAVFPFIDRLERSPRGEFELTDALTAMAQAGLRIKGYELTGAWADVRDPDVLAALNASDAF